MSRPYIHSVWIIESYLNNENIFTSNLITALSFLKWGKQRKFIDDPFDFFAMVCPNLQTLEHEVPPPPQDFIYNIRSISLLYTWLTLSPWNSNKKKRY